MVLSLSFDQVAKGLAQGLMQLPRTLVSKGIEYLHPETAEKVQAFSKSIIGQKVAEGTKALIGETVGMTIGSTYPEAMVAFTAGKALASKVTGSDESQSWIGWGAGVASALTVVTLANGLSYLIEGKIGESQVIRYVVTSMGTIVGGMEGLKAVGLEPPATDNVLDSYSVKTFQYLAARGAVQTVRSFIPVPASLMPLTGLIGGTATTLAGTAGYHGKFLVTKYLNRKPKTLSNLYDPGNFAIGLSNVAFGNTQVLTGAVAHQLNLLPMLANFVKGKIDRLVDHKTATNSVVRSLNFYADVVKKPAVKKAIQALLNESDSGKKKILQADLKKVISEAIKKKGRLPGISSMAGNKLKASLPGLIDQLIQGVKQKEKELVGFELSNLDKDLLEVLAGSFIKMAIKDLTKEVAGEVILSQASKGLSDDEVRQFYSNLAEVFLSPYTDSMIGQAAQNLLMLGTQLIGPQANILPQMVIGSIAETVENKFWDSIKPAPVAPVVPVAPKPSFFAQLSTFFSGLLVKAKQVYLDLKAKLRPKITTPGQLVKEEINKMGPHERFNRNDRLKLPSDRRPHRADRISQAANMVISKKPVSTQARMPQNLSRVTVTPKAEPIVSEVAKRSIMAARAKNREAMAMWNRSYGTFRK